MQEGIQRPDLNINEESIRTAWPVKLFNRSVLKRRKYAEVVSRLGPTEGLACLDIGADNGVISYMLRRRGGQWKSADLDEPAVSAIRELVGTGVFQIDGGRTPFAPAEFDRVAVVDFLEHIADDAGFIREMRRVLKPGGLLILNTPHRKNSLLRRFRLAIGQTDEKHGHLRPGYTCEEIARLLGNDFKLEECSTYSKFFSELVDTLIVFGVSLIKGGKGRKSSKGMIVTGQDLGAKAGMFKIYTLIYPLVWFFSKLDALLFFRSGYMLIATARAAGPTRAASPSPNGWHAKVS